MSNHKWRKALKNKKRFDPRYFMSEREEEVATKSNSEQIEQIKKFDGSFSLNSFDSSLKHEGREILKEMQLSSPMNSRFDNSGDGAAYNDQVSIGGMDDLPSEEESPCAAMNQTYFVKTSFGELTSEELEAAIATATNWMNIGVEILDASPEVLSAIGGLNEEQEELEE